MSSRTPAIVLLVAGGGVLLFVIEDSPAMAPGLFGALLGLAAVWLASGTARRVLAGLSALCWVAGLVLAFPGLGAGAALVGLAGAALTLWRGRDWPGWSSRYARGTAVADEEATPREMWESLDRGVDPTAGPDT